MKITSAILLSVFLTAAQDAPRPDQWHGLALNTSSPSDASGLGAPTSDKPERLIIPQVGKWFEQDVSRKPILRRMEFKEIEGFKNVDLFFSGDHLVAIRLFFAKPLNTEALKNIYGLDFKPYTGRAEAGIDEFSRLANPAPQGYPVLYSLVAAAEKSVVIASVDNGGVGDSLKAHLGLDLGGGYPGKVTAVTLVSRSLEDHKGADLLK
ncbi:MAG TPA: hypothetical protein VHC90_11345 [Bryobacteraceae bacterium]|nr:hypothetical protein [Bryobacteraceae bacterium]